MNATTALKWSAAFVTVLWTAGMLLWHGQFHPANIALTAAGGVVVGTIWYHLIRRFVIGRKVSQDQG